MHPALALVVAACIWGVTNPYINASSKKPVRLPESIVRFVQSLPELLQPFLLTFGNPYFIIPYLINLSGSVFFLYALRAGPLSVVTIVANALALTVTALVGRYVLHERTPLSNTRLIGSAILVLIGSSICASNPPS